MRKFGFFIVLLALVILANIYPATAQGDPESASLQQNATNTFLPPSVTNTNPPPIATNTPSPPNNIGNTLLYGLLCALFATLVLVLLIVGWLLRRMSRQTKATEDSSSTEKPDPPQGLKPSK
jgi:ABC-type Fe3+ transport system permease subunit